MKKGIISALVAVFIFSAMWSCNSEPPSEAGKSAYDIAVENGFEGSEKEWLESLKGKDGLDGKDGVDGETGINGIIGKDGVGISSTEINEDGFLMITLTDGTVINAGYVGIAKEDLSDDPLVLNAKALTIPEGKAYLLSSNIPYTKFKSSDDSVVQISPEGLVLAHSEGKATITATAQDGKESKCEIRVVCYEYGKLDNGTLEIKGYYGSEKQLDIPSEIMGISVTSIGNSAFADWDEKAGYTSVNIPDSVIHIGDYAFNSLVELTSVCFGSNLKVIGNAAFSGCKKLDNVILPDSIEEIGGAAFNMCASLTSVKIPDGVKTINGSTFDSCKSLLSVEIGSGVSYIGMFAFGDCEKLEAIIIPSTVKELDEYAFSNCSSLKSVTMSSDISYFFNTFKGTPWFEEFGGSGETPAIIPDSSFEERDETVYVYATAGDNDEHVAEIDVSAYMYPYSSGWSEKTSEYALRNYVQLKRVGIYFDESGYGWSKLEYQNSSGADIFIYVRNSQLISELPDNITIE